VLTPHRSAAVACAALARSERSNAQPSDNATSFFGGAAPSSLPAINAVWGLDALSVGTRPTLT
jgi:hypothetical protein